MSVRRPSGGLRVAFTAAVVLAVIVLATACAGDGGAASTADAGAVCPPVGGEDAPRLPVADADRADGVTDPADAGADGGLPDGGGLPDTASRDWTLPPCERACDRVVDCAVLDCTGFTWATAGTLAAACHETCDDAFVAAVFAAPDCAALLAGPAAGVAEIGALCDDNPCAISCDRLAECVVSECAAIGPDVGALLSADCQRTCNPDEIGWVLSFPTCAELVGLITASDPDFAAACSGQTTECADLADCDPYAERIVGCLQENCGDRIDPWAAGLRWALADFCRQAEPCASATDVAAILSQALTCSDSPLVDLAGVAPFAQLCDGTAGVAPEDVRRACEDVLVCAGTGWLPDADACMALIGLRDDAAALTACALAAGGCTDLFACFEEGGE